MKFLIAGLGNIGPEYSFTRHNIGFEVLEYLAAKHEGKFDLSRHAFYTEIKYKGKSLHLIKPTTYMNLSGRAVNFWLQELKLTPAQLLVVTDDLALPFGKMRLRASGSDGGHNGLKDITATLGHQNYARLRFGIGDQFAKGRQVDYVLGKWSAEEQKTLDELIARAAEAVLSFATVGLERAMNTFN